MKVIIIKTCWSGEQHGSTAVVGCLTNTKLSPLLVALPTTLPTMHMLLFDYHTQFITITCLNWLPLLQNDLHKQIIIEALKNRIQKEQVTVYAFVIMPNHMHLIWQLPDTVIRENFQRDFLKFTARSLLQFLRMNSAPLTESLKVKAADRHFQV